ncbi:MAG TPA: restriction endonuclease [Candidatus Binatia bacterium]|nr:restriction endonuclease [Candidatus Binatia bacterium]
MGVGWGEVGDLSSVSQVDGIRARVAAAFPEHSPGKQVITTRQLFKIRTLIENGDRVLTYDPVQREYLIGTVDGPYRYSTGTISDSAHLRNVTWDVRVSRDKLTPASRNTLGSTLTIFEPGEDVLADIENAIAGKSVSPAPPSAVVSEPEQGLDEIREDTLNRAHEFIKDRLLRLSPDEMEALTAALLRALGYKARVTPKGPDRGRDVIASPDGLGFQSPRVIAEVKHRRQQMGSQDLRSFIGGLRDGDRGLYVSTGGFTREARYEADRSSVPVTLVDLDDLATLVVEHYERFDSDGRALVPLVRIYWPAT